MTVLPSQFEIEFAIMIAKKRNQHPTVSTVIEHVIINITPVSDHVETSFELNDMKV